jgi:hypothetical protein
MKQLAPPTPRAAELVTMKYFAPDPGDVQPNFDEEFGGNHKSEPARRVRFTPFFRNTTHQQRPLNLEGHRPGSGAGGRLGPPKCGKSFFVSTLIGSAAR